MKYIIFAIAIFGVGAVYAKVSVAPVNSVELLNQDIVDSQVKVMRFQDKAPYTATTTCYVVTAKVGTYNYPSVSCVK